MSLGGILFICLLIFVFTWTYTKSPLLGLGAAAIFWSLLHFFVQRQENADAARQERKYGAPVVARPNDNIFRHPED